MHPTHVYEIVKEYVFYPEILSHPVRGRIIRNLDSQSSQQYMWQISHHWKTAEAGGFYHPSANSGANIQLVEQMLFAYAKSFTNITKKDENY